VTARTATAVLSLVGAAWLSAGRALPPGVLASAVLAIAAAFLSQHYGAPVMLPPVIAITPSVIAA
jgi:hypothetical protein